MDVASNAFLNVRQTARQLGVHENTVRNWVRDGVIPEARVPGSRFHRFRVEDVDRLRAQRGKVAPSLQTERRAVNPELASANQLKQWPAARARDAQENFPELIRRLLVETPGISGISIRSGDGVALQGWDGVAESKGTAFLPAGHLAFEFGVGMDPRRKATEDYNNRVADALSNRTFAFMTPLRWAGGQAWAEERRAEGHFTDVRVLDGDDLEGWLRATPGAHHWISEHLGLRPRDATTLDTWWERFSTSTDPVFPPTLFLAGRSAQADQVVDRLGIVPQLTVIQSEWAFDVLAFVYASLYGRHNPKWDVLPAIVVSAVDVWDRILEQPGRAILLPQFERADVGAALDKGHHVLSVIDESTVSRRAVDVALPRLDRRAAAEAFQAAGVDFEKADRLAVLGRRSLPALARRLSRNPRFSRPAWATGPDNSILTPLVLIGRWTTSAEDIAEIEELTGHSWEDVEQTIRRVSVTDDPVLRKIGEHWAFASPEEAFLLLQDYVTLPVITRWSEQVQAVLLAPDPLLGLTAEARLTAQMRGVNRPHSDSLRRGLAQGLALMGAMGKTTISLGGSTPSEIAALTVRRLLDTANADSTGRSWHQLADVLPLLAEAAPEDFLAAVNYDLCGAEPILLKLFQEDQDSQFSLGPSSPHPHLLWALETVCWSEQYLIDGVRCLARLAAREHGGKSGNRPRASLAAILCGWVRNTSASLHVRLQAIDVAYDISEAVGWQLIFDLWPSNHGSVMPPATPRIRDDWRPSGVSLPMAEWVTLAQQLVDRSLAHAGRSPDRLIQLVGGITTVSQSDRNRMILFLEAQSASELSEDARLQVWEKLQELVARHARFTTAAWAMPPDVLERLARVVALFEPRANLQRFTYLFGWRPDVPGADQLDHETYSLRLHELRSDALRRILSSADSVEHLARLARRAAAPGQLGWALAEHDEVSLQEMLPWFGGDDQALREAAANWARHHMLEHGAAWLTESLADAQLRGTARQTVIRNVLARSAFWQALHDSPQGEDEAEYWTTAPIDFVEMSDTAVALKQLIAHGRPWAAVTVASYALTSEGRSDTGSASNLSPAAVIRLLDEASDQSPRDGELSNMTGYYVGQLLDYLVEAEALDGDVARLEYTFFRLLQGDRLPTVLNRILAVEPNIFVNLVKSAYWGKNEPRRERPDLDENAATQAWWVLRGWEGFPGRREDGSVDAAVMNKWVKTARLELSDADRNDIGDELIGETFAHSPIGTDGVWPAVPVRDVIEAIGSRELENGVILGRLNSRGVTSRWVYDGGQQERDLAKQYQDWSKSTRAEWPRTSRILRHLAESYERDARREDIKAEIDGDRDS